MNKEQVVILGAGLAGLSLAYQLKQKGIKALILESRDRMGGRVNTLHQEGTSLELGATWFADKHVHLMTLLKELDLPIIEQEYGKYAIYEHPDGQAQLYELPAQTEASYRIKAGTSALIKALAKQLSEDQILLNHRVEEMDFSEPLVKIETNEGPFLAEIVVNTMPPNLLAQYITIRPSFAEETLQLFKSTHTWMGESIKVGLFSPKPFWLEKEIGTIYSQRGPVTEMYDHSSDSGYALKGFIHDQFITFSKEEREKAVRSQLTKFFGEEAIIGCTYVEQAWKLESNTFADYPNQIFPHQNNGHELLRKTFFDGRFFMAGSETAKSFPGYLDGAVEAASLTLEKVLKGDNLLIERKRSLNV